MKWQIAFCCGVALFAVAFSSSCSMGVGVGSSSPTVKTPGPPPHAPAHGYRKKFSYLYYPSAYVYFDVERKVYFYLEDGSWKMGARLPADIRIDAGEGVSLSLDIDRPYLEFEAHKAAHPPKGGKGPGKPGKGGKGK